MSAHDNRFDTAVTRIAVPPQPAWGLYRNFGNRLLEVVLAT